MPRIKLFDYQLESIKLLESGSILCGGVGSGKSLTSLSYYFIRECGGKIDEVTGKIFNKMTSPKDLFIITTARKRDTLEWEKECVQFPLSKDRAKSIGGVRVVIDSWNNIGKYSDISDSFFIFDEQRLVGAGAWVKHFLKISKKNRWILLTATPGDTWLDYAPVFIANGFYKNRTDFINQHVVYNSFVSFPMVDRYVNVSKLMELKKRITVYMDYKKRTVMHHIPISVSFDEDLYNFVAKQRWNVYEDHPIANVSEYCFVLRKVTNSHKSRVEAVSALLKKKKKIIVFYNYNHELEALRAFCYENEVVFSEWNGHKHEPLPSSNSWLYLVQYTSGSEGWNCVETDTILFFSQNYSYKTMQQAAGRIDRLNTPFSDLYCYHLQSVSKMDLAIKHALENKKTFNESEFAKF